MLRLISSAIAGSRAGRYWLSKLSNHEACEPLFNIAANRVAAGLRRLQRASFSPDVIVDVGANRGEWTKMAMSLFPASRFVMVEAQPEMERELSCLTALAPSRISHVITLVGSEHRASVEFFLADTGSSIYSENTAFPRRKITLPMVTLDALLVGPAAEGRCFLKLDVQGAELDVLAGANATLARTEIILTEASLVEYNLGAPRVADVVSRLHQLDFLLFDIWDLRRIGPVLAQVDLVFVRRGSPVERQAAAVIRAYGPLPAD
jgi:FkbM family methyltransferase